MMQKPSWPDWSGETAIVIASGPSLTKRDVEICRGHGKVIAIKKCVELAPWADVVYGCDGPWWRSVRGLKSFAGLRLAYDPTVCNSEYGIQKVDIPDPTCDRFLFDRVGSVGSGRNSGFQALNLAAQFGAKRIVLLGFDMQGDTGSHFYGRNNWMQANNPDQYNFHTWKLAFAFAASDLHKRSIEVINASRSSALTCFRQLPIEAALQLACEAA